eukprot:c12011_g1_i1 orf=794-3379(+)
MGTVFDGSNEQAYRKALQSMLPPGMPLPDEESLDYSFAEVYTGPRPPSVPKAEHLVFSTQVDVSSHKSCSSQSSILCMSCESFSGETLETSRSSASIVNDQFPSPSQNQASLGTGDTADMGFRSSSARGASIGEIISSFECPPGESPPSLDQEDHTTQSEFRFSGLQSSSSRSSTNSCSQELTSPEPGFSNTQKKRKGECFMCAKVNRLQDKETCLVCSAKYCCVCVVKAMGSMPQGRKCVGCIGQPVCESKRRQLGKPTRLLNRLLSTLEVQQIMKAERESPANQLRPEQVYVNRKQLTDKEFRELLQCANPPSKLKPGRYWYDGQCGYWGKEGEKPHKIISVNLVVGGDIAKDASAGCTDVYINGREITKTELRMLKLSGVQCPPQTHLWVNSDGGYSEEGHAHMIGNIWNKAKAKYFCLLVKLPLPNSHGVAPEPPRSLCVYSEPQTTYNILLIGHAGSGTSTILKQAKLLYERKFSTKELQDMRVLIQRNIHKYIIILLEARERFEDEENAIRRELEENTPSTSAQMELGDAEQKVQSGKANIFSLSARLKDQADWFLQTDASGDFEKYHRAITREHASLIEELWKDSAIQATYKRRAELHMLPDVARYFLDKVVEFSSNDYTPDDQDILFAEGGTTESGLAEIEFCLDEDGGTSGPYNENLDQPLADVRFHLIRIGGNNILDGFKFLKMFEDVQAVIFCVALDSYDQMWSDGKRPLQNKMVLSRELFGKILKYPSFKDKQMVLFFNKYDTFEEKVHKVPLTTCEWFSDFHPVKSSSQTPQVLAQNAYTYIAHMFKKHFEMFNQTGGKLYTYQLKGLEGPSVSSAFQYLKSIVCEEMKRRVLPLNSFYTTETSLQAL